MSQETNKAIVSRFFEEVLNKGNMELAEVIIATDFVDHNASPGAKPGLIGFKEFISMVGNAFPDFIIKVEDMVAEENKVTVRVTVSGTHKGMLMGSIPPTGKHATWTGIDIFGIENGKIKERWSQRDLLGLMQQLGVIPQ
jgi:steroid delta-isomerase-like uncharacterized protein